MILITVLADDQVLKNVITPDVLKRLGPGGLHISVSTISPETSRELYLQHKKLGPQYLAAPIFARPETIRAKVANICLSGDEDARIYITHQYRKLPIPDFAYDKHNDKGRQLKRGWGHFFREGTKLVNHTPQDKEEIFRERAAKAVSDPGGMGLF